VNGRQLTADDMAWNYERLHGIGRFAGEEPAPQPWGTRSILIESVTATDELTFEIKHSRPWADTHRALFDDCHIRAFAPETLDTLDDPNKLIGSGPFTMVEADLGSSITYDRNPNYWKDDEKFPGNRLPDVDRIVVLTMGDEATRLAALRLGQVDVVGEFGVARIASIQSVLDLQESNPGMQAWSIAFRNETASAIKIPSDGPSATSGCATHCRWRSTTRRSETRTSMASESGSQWDPSGQRGPAITTPSIPGPKRSSSTGSTTRTAPMRLLDEAGYPRGADGVRFRTSMWLHAQRADIGYHELQVGYWMEIGVEVELNALGGAALNGKLNSPDWEGMTWGWSAGADYGRLESSLGSYTSSRRRGWPCGRASS